MSESQSGKDKSREVFLQWLELPRLHDAQLKAHAVE